MSKKLIAALSMSFALVACNTTADVTTEGEIDLNEDVIEDSFEDEVIDETSTGAMTDTGAAIEDDSNMELDSDTTVEIGE